MQHTAIVVFLLQSLGGTNVRNVKKKQKHVGALIVQIYSILLDVFNNASP